jgi:hypothetical protein
MRIRSFLGAVMFILAMLGATIVQWRMYAPDASLKFKIACAGVTWALAAYIALTAMRQRPPTRAIATADDEENGATK